MIYSVQVIVLMVVLVTSLGSPATGGSEILQPGLVKYESLPLWQQSNPFPRWQDTYAIIFEQEMLA